jgi:hypothetical protein
MDGLDRIKEMLPNLPESTASTLDSILEHFEGSVGKTPMSEENKEINAKVSWEKAFYELILEILDFDLSWTNSKTNFTNALLSAGSQYNPQQLYQLMDLLTTRLERIHIVKRLCNFLGLQNEMDRIIDAEMDLIYKTPRYNMTRTLDLTNPVAGDIRNDR